MLKRLEESRWLDVLDLSPLVAGDARFLREFFLPAHGQLRERRYEAALAELDRRVARGGAEVVAARGRVRRLLGDSAGAARDYAEALGLDASCTAARAYLAELGLAANPAAAAAELERAVAAAPRVAAYRLWLGYALALAGDAPRALAQLDRAVALDRGAAAARVLRGILRERAEDLSGAEEDYSAVARLHPRCPGLYTLRATVRWKRGAFALSVADAHRAILLHPENLDAFMRILYLHKGLKHPEEKRSQGAIVSQIADELLREDPRCSWAYALKAEVIEDRRVALKAAKKTRFLERAVKLDPKNAWLRAFLGRALSGLRTRKSLVRRGLKELDRAVALKPRSGWIRSWRAEVIEKLGGRARALKELDRAIPDDPDYRLANAWRASLRESFGDDAGAVEDLRDCLALMPRPGFYHQRALAYWRLGSASEAAADLTRCIGRTTKHALGYGRFGWTLRFEWSAAGRGDAALARVRAELRRGAEAARSAGPFRLDPMAAKPFQVVLRAIPRCLPPSPWKGLALDAGRLGELAAKRPGDALLHAWHGRALLDAGRPAEAEAVLDRALAAAPRAFAATAWRGEARFLRDDFSGAVRDLDASLDAQPSYIPSYLWRCLAHLALNQEPAALGDLLSACHADPASAFRIAAWARWTIPGFWPRLGAACPAAELAELALLFGSPRKASAFMRRVPEKDLDAEAWILRGLAWSQQGDAARGEAEFAHAVCRDAAAAASRLAFYLKQLPHIGPETMAKAYYAISEAEALSGREPEARRAYATALGLDAKAAPVRRAPGLAGTLLMRAQLRRETGDLAGALEDAKQASRLQAAR